MTDDNSARFGKSPDEVKIIFTPSGRQGHVPVGTTVLKAARTLGVDIDSVCGGRALCGRCQIRLPLASLPNMASPRALKALEM